MKKVLALAFTVLFFISTVFTCVYAEPGRGVPDLLPSDAGISDDTESSGDAQASGDAADSADTETIRFDSGNIKNGDFEDGNESWSFYSYENNGSYMQITDDEYGKCIHIYANSPDDARAIQNVSVFPECYYRISALVKTSGVAEGNGANLAVEEVAGVHSTSLFGDNDWQELSFNIQTGKNTKMLTLGLRVGGYSAESGGDAWFDNVKFEFLDRAPEEFISVDTGSTESIDKSEEGAHNFTLLTIAILAAIVMLTAVAVFFILHSRKKTKKTVRETDVTPKNAKERDILINPSDTKMHWKKVDWIFISGLTLIYAIVSLTRLGSLQAPQTEWRSDISDAPVVLRFKDGQKQVSKIYVYGSILGELDENGTISVYDSDDKELCTYTEIYRDMFRWHDIYSSYTPTLTDSVKIDATGNTVAFREIVLIDEKGNTIPCTTVSEAQALIDETDEFPDELSVMNGMYFDELYHGRTAYEHANNLKSYENSHPPLGKLIIAIGIAVFGMNAFGWRVMGALFGVAMLPVFYCLCKRIFKKKSSFAMAATTLFAFDFMHYVQTRIATIDVYGVFFILLMFYFMYWYFTMSFYRDGLGKTLLPLGLCGLSFGLGAASKWICFYAGAGLALLLLISFIKRVDEWRRFKNSTVAEYREAVSDCWKNIILTCLFCVGFFIIIPVIIYALSYLGYPDVKLAFADTMKNGGGIFKAIGAYLNKVWGYQTFMYNYHSGLTSTHTYQSTWLQWIFDLRPIWYAIHYYDNGYVGTISAFGNPIVWWLSAAGTVGMIVQVIRRKIKLDSTVIVILVGIACNLLPWVVFVKRCVFIYHYFATVPFIILAAMYFIQSVENDHEWFAYFKWVWTACALVLFGIFYPVLSGLRIPESYALGLEWFKSWWFVRNAPAPSNAGVANGIITIIVIAVVFAVCGFVYKRFLDKNEKDGER